MRAIALSALLTCAATASAGTRILDDASAFDGVEHTLIDFETRADGTDPFAGFAGEIRAMPNDEYITMGVRWLEGADPDWIRLFRDGIPEALAAGGSPDLFMGVGGSNPFIMEFTVPVRAVGFFALSDRLAGGNPPPPSGIRAFDDDGNVLGEAFLEGDLLDGQIELIEFGFMGFSSDVNIRRIEVIRTTGFGIDDLRFSPVPAPATAAPLLLGAITLARRRR